LSSVWHAARAMDGETVASVVLHASAEAVLGTSILVQGVAHALQHPGQSQRDHNIGPMDPVLPGVVNTTVSMLHAIGGVLKLAVAGDTAAVASALVDANIVPRGLRDTVQQVIKDVQVLWYAMGARDVGKAAAVLERLTAAQLNAIVSVLQGIERAQIGLLDSRVIYPVRRLSEDLLADTALKVQNVGAMMRFMVTADFTAAGAMLMRSRMVSEVEAALLRDVLQILHAVDMNDMPAAVNVLQQVTLEKLDIAVDYLQWSYDVQYKFNTYKASAYEFVFGVREHTGVGALWIVLPGMLSSCLLMACLGTWLGGHKTRTAADHNGSTPQLMKS